LWKVGLNDGVNGTVIAAINTFFFQLDDATGADNYTLGSPGFYIQSSTVSPTTSYSGGLDTGAKIAVGLGIPLALITGITSTLAWVYFYRRANKRRLKRQSALDDQQRIGMPSEVDGTSRTQNSELPAEGWIDRCGRTSA
jgi:hypothetical protein